MKKLASVALAAMALLGATQASATVYSLTTGDGVGFSITTVDSTHLTLNITNALSAPGTWASAGWLDNIAFKDLGTGLAGSLTPGSWASSTSELTASGCTGGDSGGLCFTSNASPGYALTDNMSFSLTLTSGTFNYSTLGPHLKVRFVDAGGAKVGSLLSQNLPAGGGVCTKNCDDTVPEPGSIALVGVALLGLGALRRRSVGQRATLQAA